jgi:hypothetical protein
MMMMMTTTTTTTTTRRRMMRLPGRPVMTTSQLRLREAPKQI